MGTLDNKLAEIDKFIKANSNSGSTKIMVGVDTSGPRSRQNLDFATQAIDVITSDLKTNAEIFTVAGARTGIEKVKSFTEMYSSRNEETSDVTLAFVHIINNPTPVDIGVIITDGHTTWPEERWLAAARNSQGQPIKWLIVGTAKDDGQYDIMLKANVKIIVA